MANKKQNKLEELLFKQESFWDLASPKEQNLSFEFAEDYKKFLNISKTERQTIHESVKLAKKEGYKEVSLDEKLPRGNKFYFINRNKSAIFISLGENKLSQGIKMLMAHVDAPRLDLKVRPLYEDSGLAYFKSHYYGGIKKYHWPTIPLNMVGTVVLKSGEEIEINIGDKKDDPVFLISDLLPHLDRQDVDKPKVKGEEMNIIIGSRPVNAKKAKDRVKLAILKWLHENYKMKQVDLFAADIRFVPSFPARDIGFDKSMVAGYGQDDRVCVYTALQALIASKDDNTKLLFLADKEEIASDGSTGAKSLFLDNILEYLLYETNTPLSVNDLFRKSQAISADTTGAFDPDYKDKQDISNAVNLGQGVVIEKHAGCGGKYYTIDAEPQFIRQIINLFDKKKVVWQTGHMGKIDQGGGGTLAIYLANRNIEVIDIGVALLNLHSPYELASKADIYSAYRGYQAFLEN